MNTTNREWITKIQDQLKADLAVIQPTLDKHLETLNNQLDNFNKPLRETAEQIRGNFQGFVDFTRRIIGDLKVELNKQNEKYKDQLEASKDLNQQILALMKQLDKNSENQSAAVSTLSSNVGDLTNNTKDLTTNIQSFTSDIGALRTSIDENSQSSKTLADSIERLARQSSSSVGRSSEKIRQDPLLKRIWNTLLRKKWKIIH